MWILKVAAAAVYTVVLGVPAILSVLVAPRGDYVLWFARVWSRWVAATAGVRFRVIGADRIDWSGNYLIVSNHQSQFDVPALVCAIPVPFRMVAKRNLFYIPIFGWALYLGGFISIDRSNRERAIRSLERAAALIRRGASLAVFAEGTRGPGDRLLPFKKGPFVLAIEAGATIVPVVLRGGRAILPKGTLRVRPGTMEVIFGRPVPAGSFSYDDRERLIEQVHADMQALLDGPAAAVPPDPAAGSETPADERSL